ncbi:hypothetical protein TRFO_12975 [Tritrichomonas foetus]|uniref:Protein kinase domain-containing protein n=1 Tax=Tritrichomonas foetus TaxID=1144522 RepID=A0A1J4L415_9EUKA|nr:hypothetical protein TRFO_12975 [Tritrichomonas foetus]|eukprot:OHT16716.1 hypothetical protein TRFO_12975 [Tritrichomonas foetus]
MLPQINVKKFQRADNLGKNPRRITYLAKDPDRGMCLIVVKEFLMISSQNFMESLHFFDSVRHPSLQKIYGYFPGDPETPPSLIFEYQTKRSVKVILKMIKHEPISQTTIMKICFGVAFALNLLHRHQPQIIHKNVNTSTVLLNEKYDPCLAGTGLYECNENPKYNAPELAKEQKYTTASDVYAYGILLKRILKASFGQNIPKMYRILISRCISANIETRPIFSEILKLLDTIEFKLPEIDEHNYAAYRSNLISTKPFDVANFKANQNIQQQQMMQQQQMHFHQAHMLMNSQHQRPHRNIDNFYPGNIQVNYPPVQNNFLPPTFAPNMMPMQMSIPMPNPNYMIQGLPLNPYSIYNDGVDINISSNYNPMNGAIPPVQYPDQIKNPMSNQFNNNLNINQMNSSISSVSSQRVNSSRIPVGLHSDPLQNNYTLSTKSGSVKGKRILMPETFVVESEGVVAAPDYDLDNEVCTPNDLDEFDNLAQPDTSCQIAIPESEI